MIKDIDLIIHNIRQQEALKDEKRVQLEIPVDYQYNIENHSQKKSEDLKEPKRVIIIDL